MHDVSQIMDELRKQTETDIAFDGPSTVSPFHIRALLDEVARLRSPAGDVGQFLANLENWRTAPRSDLAVVADMLLGQCIDIMLRQAGEIERLTKELGQTAEEKHALSLQLHDQSAVMTRATSAEALLREAGDLLRDACEKGLIYWAPQTTTGYVKKAEMLKAIDAFLAKLEATDAGGNRE